MEGRLISVATATRWTQRIALHAHSHGHIAGAQQEFSQPAGGRELDDKIEESETRHYDTFAQHKTRRDVLLSSRIPRRDIVIRSVKPIVEKRGGSLGCVVDIGCGIGASAVYMNGLFDRYIGVDFSKGMIDIAHSFTAEIPNVEFMVANVKETTLPAGCADVVYMDGALHHMTDLPRVMQSMTRIAKPGAWFIAREPQRANPLIQLLRWSRMRIDPSYSSDQRFFLKRELTELLAEAGLDNIEARYQGFLTPPLAQVVLHPQALFAPVSRAAVALEGVAEKAMLGPLGALSWNITVYGQFPNRELVES